MCLFLISCLLLARIILANTLHVPQDYLFIQDAFNALQDSDTILVDTGIYAEALTAPPLHFTMLGNVQVEPGDFPRPIVNPSSLVGSNALACLIIPVGATVTIEKVKFVNDFRMYPRRDILDYGGIKNYSALPVIFRYCDFDSTYMGISRGIPQQHQNITLENCRFHKNNQWCVLTAPSALHATDCVFSGYSQYSLISCSGNSSFVRCVFTGYTLGPILNFYGLNLNLADCTIGPCSLNVFTPIAIRIDSLGGQIEYNRICNMNLTAGATAMGIGWSGGDPINFVHNTFTHVYDISQTGVECLRFGKTDSSLVGLSGIIESNFFDSCSSISTRGKAISLSGQVQIQKNYFSNIQFANYPVIWMDSLAHYSILRENIFAGNNGYAAATIDDSLDAIWNYWGDSTGPYHSILNPNGQGDEVGNNVLFTPWYTDTLFFNEVAHDPHILHPSSFSIEVYPNPFNSSVSLVIAGFTGREFRLTLHNLLGQEIAEIVSGPVTGGRFVYNAPASLASGIYFVKAADKSFVQVKEIVLLK